MKKAHTHTNTPHYIHMCLKQVGDALYRWRRFPRKLDWMLYQHCTIKKRLLDMANFHTPPHQEENEKAREWGSELLTGKIALKIQHLFQKKLASRLLSWSFKSNWPLSAINERNQKKISHEEKSPVKHFLEWYDWMVEAIWPEASLLHVLKNNTNCFRSKPATTFHERHNKRIQISTISFHKVNKQTAISTKYVRITFDQTCLEYTVIYLALADLQSNRTITSLPKI